MHIVIFGLTVSSSWGNGHATLWRALLKALAKRGHTASFYEHDVSYYADNRDDWAPPRGIDLKLYNSLEEIRGRALRDLNSADVGMFTSYCPDGAAAAELILSSRAEIKCFYDLDTPVTLTALANGETVAYLPPDGLGDFDLVLSYTGGRALSELQSRLGARTVAPLYGSVDPEAHFPVPSLDQYRGILSYLGTFASDRQQALEMLFLDPARRLRNETFQLAGAQYPESFSSLPNVAFVPHLAPQLHPAFFCSSRATLNITRRVMAEYGYCPSGRLFEAAACGVPIVSDGWDGLEMFLTPGQEILRVDTSEDVIEALSLPEAELRRIAEAARERVLANHTAERRVMELEGICEGVSDRVQAATELQ
ncbi:CgeB family protein [Occallatibacter savannae]|uniref:CgeB family protein n=1 Tax=Occallatibacter savannae TaxID=1002691 RepID=UPI000D6985B7|nr:glycosyltransferase [Occallatibacter savannae]